MPAVRDTSFNFNTSTATTLVIPIPAYAQNDLLLALISVDTGTAAITSPGWTTLFNSTSTSQLVCLYKIAGASETDVTFTYTLETAVGCIISIRDVNTVNPFGPSATFNAAAGAVAVKVTMQQLTTTVGNSLVLYANGRSVVGAPSFLEGPVTGIFGGDGGSESLGVGWGFMPVAGLTPNNVVVSGYNAAAANVKAVIQIAPPTGGATVVPAYCASDASLYIDPIHGVTAYNGNTALAATADTNWGTTLGSQTANDATVSSVADVGINSFHSVGRLTTATGTKLMGGADLVMSVANRPSLAGKNVLVHCGPSTEGQLQRFSNVPSGRGLWFGLRSAAATNYKAWQVRGVENGDARQLPVVINSDAANAKASKGTLNAASIFSFGFWASGSGVTTTAWDFASLWVLDTCVVAGGLESEPVGISGIVNAAATGKERRSVVRQGAKQALVLGPLQLGNGGTHPIYLDLDSTAIEFPRQYNASTAEVAYNSVDDVAGITYYAGAADTLKHRNSVISSASKYHWRIHASSSPSAAYDFKGLSVIGAGDVQLRAVTTFTSIAFVSCPTIVQNSAVLSACTFTGSTISACNDPSKLSGCTFSSGGTGHALVLTVPGTYSFVGNQFSDYGAGGTTDAAVYNNSGGAVTLNVSGGAVAPTVRNGAGASTVVNNNVSVTIGAAVGLVGAEVRIYDLDNTPAGSLGTELDGVESNGGSTFVYSGSGGNLIWIQIMKPGYKEFGQSYTMPSSNGTLTVLLVPDTNA